MRVSKEFSKNALYYNSRNIIQKKVAQKLLTFVKNNPQSILDLGCGRGEICKNISWSYQQFLGVDFAEGMLKLHPKSPNIKTILGDFNNQELFNTLSKYSFDYIISASALQWANDLEMVFKELNKFNTPVALAIFTSNTFKTLYKTASIEPILRSAQEIETLQKKYFNANVEIIDYKLEFESTREIFKYIKQSGVSASRNILSYKDMKKLLNSYPVNYLEFEVIYIYT